MCSDGNKPCSGLEHTAWTTKQLFCNKCEGDHFVMLKYGLGLAQTSVSRHRERNVTTGRRETLKCCLLKKVILISTTSLVCVISLEHDGEELEITPAGTVWMKERIRQGQKGWQGPPYCHSNCEWECLVHWTRQYNPGSYQIRSGAWLLDFDHFKSPHL